MGFLVLPPKIICLRTGSMPIIEDVVALSSQLGCDLWNLGGCGESRSGKWT